jgi:hypothetical protein
LNVDQTVGNYHHNKFARSLIAAGVPATYSLNKKYDVVVLKAGIMKRFGFDSLNPIMAAKEYDSVIDKWMALEEDRPGILKEAGKEEGFASVAAILEGIKFKKALDKPNQPIYVSSFFTEIDGKTNGLAHAAAQSGDMSNAAGALIFDDEDYATWNKYYDELAPLVAAEDVKAIRDLAIEKKIDPSVFENFLDAYHKVNNQLLKNFLDIKTGKDAQGNAVTFPGMISQNATEAFKQIMQTAQDRGGLEKFKRALEIFDQSRLGRKFTKKPVMIFAYGAGDARHADEVKAFIDAILRRDGIEFQQLFENDGPITMLAEKIVSVNKMVPASKKWKDEVDKLMKETRIKIRDYEAMVAPLEETGKTVDAEKLRKLTGDLRQLFEQRDPNWKNKITDSN